MKPKIRNIFWLTLLFLVFTTSNIYAQLNVQAIDVAGDSISKGFNAKSSFPCSNGDEEQYNWLTSVTNGTNSCGAGNENVFSLIERLRCETGTNILAPNPNHAASGAQMLNNFVNQSGNIQLYLSSQLSPRLAVVFLGHNDACSGKITKTNTTCANADQDLNNYCRTKNDSFEREFRKGLDILMTIPNTRIAISAPVRASQLCNFTSKSNCQLAG
ncbi:MAG: SGNH/GDSL hydrolase family protein, partial [Pyrinomonadaceae bacterium]|nr:SGNH/GDSL hydrolase family protein [Pyrinomonadaceae bacterium]